MASHAHKENVLESISSQTVGLFTGKKSDAQLRKQLDESQQLLVDVENRLKQLAR